MTVTSPETKNDVGEFFDAMSGIEPEPVVPEPVTPEPEPVVTDPEPITPEPVVPEPEPEPAEETSEQIIESLRAQILEMSQQMGVRSGLPNVQPEVSTETPATTPQVQAPVVPPQMLTEALAAANYLSEEELDKLIDEPQLINVAIQRANQQTAQLILANIPQIVAAEAQKQMVVSLAVQEFYNQHQDLRPYSNYVKFVFAELENKGQDMTYEELFKEAAQTTRKRLGLKNPEVVTPERPTGEKPNPGFAGSKTNRRPAPQPIVDPDIADVLAAAARR